MECVNPQTEAQDPEEEFKSQDLKDLKANAIDLKQGFCLGSTDLDSESEDCIEGFEDFFKFQMNSEADSINSGSTLSFKSVMSTSNSDPNSIVNPENPEKLSQNPSLGSVDPQLKDSCTDHKDSVSSFVLNADTSGFQCQDPMLQFQDPNSILYVVSFKSSDYK